MKCFSYIVIVWGIVIYSVAAENDDDEDPYKSLKKKSVLDYTDADIERLYDQWEEADDEPLEEDELPEWKRPRPQIDLSKLDPNNPEKLISMSKKGQTLMMFVSVSGNPSEAETEEITSLWQSSLFNAHYDIQRYVVGTDRALFMLKDGSKAWEVKDFLIDQDRCDTVTIEGKDYPGKGSNKAADTDKEKKKDDKAKKKKTEESKKKKKSSENETDKKKKTEL